MVPPFEHRKMKQYKTCVTRPGFKGAKMLYNTFVAGGLWHEPNWGQKNPDHFPALHEQHDLLAIHGVGSQPVMVLLKVW